MDNINIIQVHPSDHKLRKEWEALLLREGIRKDLNIDYTIGLLDEKGRMLATGSCFRNSLRCLAVDSEYQGTGLLGQAVSALVDFQYHRGNTHLFLYTKCETARYFQTLGFYEIARVQGEAVFMENTPYGFTSYIKNLQKGHGLQSAIVMNANPFTLGHRWLVERACRESDTLHLFIVSEDVSQFPFAVREKLIREGTADLGNIVYHPTEDYLVSTSTFPSYFLKEPDQDVNIQATLDAQIFIQLAKALNISTRYVGEEPLSFVTNIYNGVLKKVLTAQGINCIEIPRRQSGGQVISASRVRALLLQKDFDAIKSLVPDSTYRYLLTHSGENIMHCR
ncbi:MAG: [citrate (pro-3S)-lyase] ligase [Pseudomonadota bacterium]